MNNSAYRLTQESDASR